MLRHSPIIGFYLTLMLRWPVSTYVVPISGCKACSPEYACFLTLCILQVGPMQALSQKRLSSVRVKVAFFTKCCLGSVRTPKPSSVTIFFVPILGLMVEKANWRPFFAFQFVGDFTRISL